ncbi:MAG TPA: alpha/beta fold hydrolase [Actinomycetes bacterium]|nr:alpha/beta fold hydrolase [Actinomycetes bacterium]
MRAREPDADGFVERDGVKLHFEVFGDAEPTLLLLPTWTVIHARFWKAQVPYLARHFRVVTYDGPGNGRSDRPLEPGPYGWEEQARAAAAVLDATGTDRAVLVSLSMASQWALWLMAQRPEQVAGSVFIGPSLALAAGHQGRQQPFEEPYSSTEGWAKYNRHYWRDNYQDFLEFFFSQCFTEPHSTKPIEDAVGWGLETSAAVLIAESDAKWVDEATLRDWCAASRCPVLVIHGAEDAISPLRRAEVLAEATGGTLTVLEGAGHIPLARDPVRVNKLVAEFAGTASATGAPADGVATRAPAAPAPARRTWARALRRPRRALYLSSPIGLGHARRDLAIARELRRQVPGLEIDWLAQDPVTRVLEAEGERIHPASAWLASESAHIERESAEHDLHAFQAIRRMDEILIANFMVFHDVVREQPYDLWIGDEAWELDYYLHENPEEKRAAYVWLTDFVGWLPMPDGGQREAYLTADYNAEMIEHIDRFPRLRDRAVFVGNPGDIVPDRFGPGLPAIREWVEGHYSFSGYITGFDPAGLGDRHELRRRLGYRPDERVCVVTVGGSGVGSHLLRRVIAAYPEARRQVPGLRMVVGAGPRIDPASLPSHDGLEIHPYVHNLYQHLVACDLAVVQGGLTTCMELAAAGRPFLYFPLAHHFEQNFHVHHRLRQYDAGRRMEFATATPEVIAAAIAAELGREVAYRPVETDGAARAASLIAELL